MKALIFTILLVTSVQAGAVLYKWVDKDGVTRYTTAPPPESAKSDREIINKRGQTVKKIKGARTAEERAAEERRLAEEEQRLKDLKAAEKRDRTLVTSYKDVSDLLAKRDARIAFQEDQLKSLQAEYTQVADEYMKLTEEAIVSERAGRLPAESLKGNIRSARREFNDLGSRLAEAKSKRAKIERRFEDDIQRFKELKGLN